MVATISVNDAVANDELDYGLLLIAHLICADGQIHIQEARALQSLSQEIGSAKITQDALEAILSKNPKAPAVHVLADRVLPGQQIETLKQLLAIACIDSYLAPVEASFINGIAKLWNISEVEVKRLQLTAKQAQRAQSVSDVDQDDLSTGAQILKGAESLLSRALVRRLTAVAPKSLGRQVHKLQQEILLAGPEYDEAIDRCARVAQKDYKFADSSLKSARKTLKLLREDLQDVLDRLSSQINRGSSGKTLIEVVSQLEATRQELDDKTAQELENIQAALKAKHRSLNHFTIAFMGKTKAGKSTLHATITGEGWDAIGVGMQRTTRYNRVYEWKNIRIIDTPGIGAPGGEIDEAIAKSVVDESDVICYVVTDDSIQETEFEFMSVLRERTKPLLILLNVKNNLKDSRRLEYFLKNPNKLFPRGENGLDGHINRIKRYAAEHYANGYVDVVPVMLLAAQLARKNNDKRQADRLLEASRLQDFLNSLRMAIVDYGPIRRSQTLLGSTVYSVEKPIAWAKEQASYYHQQSETIASQRDRLKKEFAKALTDVQTDLEIKIKDIFAGMSQSIYAFALGHWESSAEEIQKAWKSKLKQDALNQRLETAAKEAQSELEQRTKQTLEEIETELRLLANFKISSQQIEQTNQGFFEKNKGLLALSGMLIGTLALLPPLAPFAPLLIGIGAVVGFFTSKLRSKHKRRTEAANHICDQLTKQLDANEEKILKQTQQQIEKCSETMSVAVDSYFKDLSNGLEQISDCLRNTEASLRDTADNLNKAYAERIIEWATGKAQRVSNVQRDFGKQIEIWPAKSDSAAVPLKRSVDELSRILQETIIIH